MPSLDELKAHLNKSGSTSDDAELERFLRVAERIVATEVAGTTEEWVTASRGVVVLRQRPAGAVTLTTPSGEELSGFSVDTEAGLLRDVPYTGSLAVAYAARQPDPDVLDTAELMIAARLWETQRGNSPTILQGGDDPQPFIPGLSGILTEVRSLLAAAGEQRFVGLA